MASEWSTTGCARDSTGQRVLFSLGSRGVPAPPGALISGAEVGLDELEPHCPPGVSLEKNDVPGVWGATFFCSCGNGRAFCSPGKSLSLFSTWVFFVAKNVEQSRMQRPGEKRREQPNCRNISGRKGDPIFSLCLGARARRRGGARPLILLAAGFESPGAVSGL